MFFAFFPVHLAICQPHFYPSIFGYYLPFILGRDTNCTEVGRFYIRF
jgi:hypothetical protein